MKVDPLEMTMLFDFYGDVLTDKQKDSFDLYYNQDLSLAEIAEHSGITRQGVRDVILRATEMLTEMEEKLGLLALHRSIRAALSEIKESAVSIEGVNHQYYGNAAIRIAAQRIQTLAGDVTAKV